MGMTHRVEPRVKFDSQFDTQLGKSGQTLADESDSASIGFEYETTAGGLRRTTQIGNGMQAFLAHSGGPWRKFNAVRQSVMVRYIRHSVL